MNCCCTGVFSASKTITLAVHLDVHQPICFKLCMVKILFKAVFDTGLSDVDFHSRYQGCDWYIYIYIYII